MKLTNYQVITGVLASALFGEVNFLPPSQVDGVQERELIFVTRGDYYGERENVHRQKFPHSIFFLPLPASFSRRENQELRHRAYVQYRGGCCVVPQSSWENRATHVSHLRRACAHQAFHVT